MCVAELLSNWFCSWAQHCSCECVKKCCVFLPLFSFVCRFCHSLHLEFWSIFLLLLLLLSFFFTIAEYIPYCIVYLYVKGVLLKCYIFGFCCFCLHFGNDVIERECEKKGAKLRKGTKNLKSHLVFNNFHTETIFFSFFLASFCCSRKTQQRQRQKSILRIEVCACVYECVRIYYAKWH